MSQYVSNRVRENRDDPQRGASIEVAVQVPSEHLDTTASWVESHGGNVTDRVSIGLLEATVPESELDALCQLEHVSAVEATADHISVLNAGN